MTKKAMIEKYSNRLQEIEETKEFYTNNVKEVVNAYCTIEEIGQNSLRQLVNLTAERATNKQDISRLNMYWAFLQKSLRETTVLKEILSDLK